MKTLFGFLAMFALVVFAGCGRETATPTATPQTTVLATTVPTSTSVVQSKATATVSPEPTRVPTVKPTSVPTPHLSSAGTLTIVANAAIGNVSVIEGGEMLVGSYLLQTDRKEGMNCSSLNIDITLAGSSKLTQLSSMRVRRVDTGVQLGSTVSVPGVSNTFEIANQLNIPSATTIQIDVYVNTSKLFSDGGTDDTIATNFDSGDVVCAGAVSGAKVLAPSAQVAGRVVTVVEKGSLAVSVDTAGAVGSRFLTSGSKGEEMLRVKLCATVENMEVRQLVLAAISGTGSIAKVKLLGTGLAQDPVSPLVGNKAVFYDIAVPAFGCRVVTATVEITSVGVTVAGQLSALGFLSLEAVGVESDALIQPSLYTSTQGGGNDPAYYVAGTDVYSGDIGDIVYSSVGTSRASGFYMVTADRDAVNLAKAGLNLNGEPAGTPWTAGDVVNKLDKVESVAGNGKAGTEYRVGDVIYVYDSDDNEAGFAIVTTGVNAGDNISGLAFSPGGSIVISAAADRVTKLTNASALMGATVRMEEVEPVITLHPQSPAGLRTPGADQVVAMFQVTASGFRDLTFNGLTLEQEGNNNPEQYVSGFSLWNGNVLIARADTVVKAEVADSNVGNTINLCTDSALSQGEMGNVTAAEAATLAVGDRIAFSVSGGADTDTSTVTITDDDGTLDACDGNAATGRVLTFDGNVTVDADDTTVIIYNSRVHFSNEGRGFAEQIVTAGQTVTLTVRADTTRVRTGVGPDARVTFSMRIPGMPGPLQVAVVDAPTADTTQTEVEGFRWDYTPLGSGTAAYRTEADSYPVAGGVLEY